MGGLSFTGALQIVFIVLKLIGKVNWSWPVVLLPLEISAGIIVLYFVVRMIILIKTGDDLL